MCGIVGIISSTSKNKKKNLKNMMQSIQSRGMDQSGEYFFDNCALGHLRLSIIDLKTGNQPMLSTDSKRGIVFNGEIYGYKKIKNDLKYNFTTNSDTEVILAMYDKYQDKLLEGLPGMFSFALWDDERQELFCARDRFGEKPFYYALGKNNEFIFASEIKAILNSGLIEPIIDKNSIAHYLQRLYIHPGKTIYKNIFVLPPASFLKLRNGKVNIKKYWNLPDTNNNIDFEEAVLKFEDLFKNAVEKTLVSDVPVGVFLSGGLDSTSIVAVASEFKKNLTTISFGFEGSYNELFYARKVSQMYNTNHLELTDNDYDIGELLVEMQNVYDEPFADSSNIPSYLLSKFTATKFKVILGGDGADELLGGYDYWYRELFFLDKIFNKKINNLYFKGNVLKIFKFLNFSLSNNSRYLLNAFNLNKKVDSIYEAHLLQNTYFTDQEIKYLGINHILDHKNNDFKINNNLNDALCSDVINYLPGDILVKTDRASMSNGLELRSPYLERDFASFCLSLPVNFKISEKEDKIILRRAFEKKWPEPVRIRSKQGFGAPIHKWLMIDTVKEIKNEYLKDKNKYIYNILSYDNCSKYFNDNNYKTWILLVLSLWLEKNKYKIDA